MSLRHLIRNNKTLGFKLALWYSGFFFFSVLLLFVLTYFFLYHTLQRDDHRVIKTEINETASEYKQGGLARASSHIKDNLLKNEKFRKRSHFFYRFAQEDNNTVKIIFPHQWAKFELSTLETVPPGEGKWITVQSKKEKHEYSLELTSKRLPDGNWLQVGMSTESRLRVLDRFLESFMYVGIFLLLASFVGGYCFSRWALSPIRHLIQTVRTIEKGDMDARVPQPKTYDELGELVRLFNSMLAKIQTLIQGMKNSLDNVAHELRTPMTRMHNIAETALRSENDKEKYKEALEGFVEESDRILKMLNSLMDISEAQTGVMNLDLKEFNIKDLIDPVVEVYSFLAEEKDLDILTEIDDDIVLYADFNRISQVLANLLDNAIKFSLPETGPIYVRVWQFDAEVVIAVSDSGKGIEEKELPNIWDRLYRGSINQDGVNKGLGLGLAQVRAIVSAHDGWVDVSSKSNQGSVFSIHLPQ